MSAPSAERGPITVVKVGGAAIDHAAELGALWRGLGALHATLHERGGGVILVHGGGAAVDARTLDAGMKPIKRDGVRITPPEQLGLVVGALAGEVNAALCGHIEDAGTPTLGVTLASAGLACAPATDLGFEAGCVGRVVDVETETGSREGGASNGERLRRFVGLGVLAVVSSIGREPNGGLLNVNADDAAGGIALAVGATRLVFLTEVPGVNDASGALIASLDAGAIARLVEQGVIAGGMVPKTRAALAGAQRAGAPAVIASWRDEAVFAKLETGEPVGTRVTAWPQAGREVGPGVKRSAKEAASA